MSRSLVSTIWFAGSLLVALAAAVAWALLDGPGHPFYVLEAIFLVLGLVLVYLVAAGRLGCR